MTTTNNIQSYGERTSFYIGCFLIATLGFALLISSVTFYLGGTIGYWQFPLAVLFAVFLNYFLLRQDGASEKPRCLYLKVFGIPLALVLLSILVSAYFYDVSYDGQAYHQEAVIQLANGWNPYWDDPLPESVNQAIWVNHYAKGMETIQASIYAAFGNIEAGKATNMMLWMGSFFLVVSCIGYMGWLPLKKGVLLGALFASNPVVMNQLITHYVDGVLASLLLCLLAVGICMVRRPERRHLLVFTFIIVLIVNVKFTAIVYVVLIAGGFLLWLVFQKKWPVFKVFLLVSLVAGVISVAVGYNPYVTNTVGYGHPFHPLMGKETVDIMVINTPADFKGKSELQRFFISLFSRTEIVYPWDVNVAKLKIPFAIYEDEIISTPRVDCRLGGFGPFFSGILLLAVVLLVIQYRKGKNKLVFYGIMWFIAITIISFIIMPESWWARYVPHFWFMPLAIVLGAEVLLPGGHRFLKGWLYVAVVLNIGFSFAGVFLNSILKS